MPETDENKTPLYVQEAVRDLLKILPGGSRFEAPLPAEATRYMEAIEHQRDDLKEALERAQRLKGGRKGVVRPGEIVDCYSIVCGDCGLWVTSYRSSSVFVAEDLEGGGWVKKRKKGWVCPDCAKKSKAEAKKK